MADKELIRKLVTDRPPEKVRDLAESLSKDPRLLKKFVDSPSSVLKEFGVEADPDIKLGDREKSMIRMFSDRGVIDLYSSGQIDKLREYIIAEFPEITIGRPGDLRAVAVADFDVAIEVEVVAVAVAVAAVVVAGVVQLDAMSRYATLEAETGLMNAKIAALEARINMVERLEAKINRMEARMR